MIQRRRERDLQFILPLIASLGEGEFQLFVLFQAAVVRHASAGALPPLLDEDVADAAATVAATLETAGKGIIYEPRAGSLPAQRLADQFQQVVASLHERAGSARRRLDGQVTVVLRVLERAARTAAERLEGDEAPVYLGVARRMIEQIGAPPVGAQDADRREAPRLIQP